MERKWMNIKFKLKAQGDGWKEKFQKSTQGKKAGQLETLAL